MYESYNRMYESKANRIPQSHGSVHICATWYVKAIKDTYIGPQYEMGNNMNLLVLQSVLPIENAILSFTAVLNQSSSVKGIQYLVVNLFV